MDDLIFREQLRRAVNERTEAVLAENKLAARFVIVDDLRKAVDDAISYAPGNKAAWIPHNNPNYSPWDGSKPYYYTCSRCHNSESRASEWCPNCGADMRDSPCFQKGEAECHML